jgi:hypothetical protein
MMIIAMIVFTVVCEILIIVFYIVLILTDVAIWFWVMFIVISFSDVVGAVLIVFIGI